MKGLKGVGIVFLAIIAAILATISAFETGLIVAYGVVMKAMNETRESYRRPIHYTDYNRNKESGDE